MVVGPKPLLKKFTRSHWDRILEAKNCQLVENSPGRYVTEFNTEQAPILDPLRKLSLRWTKLIFLLDWEWEDKRLKGSVNAKDGIVESYRLEY
jgi:hypothetical protein